MRICYLRRITEKKGAAVLIDAVSSLARRKVPIELHLAGTGYPLEDIERARVAACQIKVW